ncbi:hypothetical protein C0J52_09868 [Blattella germanica]|nr:hypothetical protein C0J52_09868 [Blattella germanica]
MGDHEYEPIAAPPPKIQEPHITDHLNLGPDEEFDAIKLQTKSETSSTSSRERRFLRIPLDDELVILPGDGKDEEEAMGIKSMEGENGEAKAKQLWCSNNKNFKATKNLEEIDLSPIEISKKDHHATVNEPVYVIRRRCTSRHLNVHSPRVYTRKHSARNYSASRSNENARQNNSKTWIFHKSKASRPESNFSKKARGIASLYRRNWTAADRRYIATPPRPPEIIIKKQTISYSDAKNKPCKRIYENKEPTKLFSSYQGGNKPKEKLNLAPEIEGTNICDKQSSFQKTLITSVNEKFTHPLQVALGNSNVVDTTENAWDVCKENKTDIYKHSVNKKSDASTKIVLINNAVLEARNNFIKLYTEIKKLNAVISNLQTEGEFLLKGNNEELKLFKQLNRNYRITNINQVANRNISLIDKLRVFLHSVIHHKGEGQRKQRPTKMLPKYLLTPQYYSKFDSVM